MREPVREKQPDHVEQIQQRYAIGNVEPLESTPDTSIKRALVRINHALHKDEGRPGFTLRGYQVSENALREEIAAHVEGNKSKYPLWYFDDLLQMPVLEGYDITEEVLQREEYNALVTVAHQMTEVLNSTLTGEQHAVLIRAKDKPVCMCIATPLPWGEVTLHQVWSENLLDTTKPLHVGVVSLIPQPGAFFVAGPDSASV